jgi:hypothetical protein
LKLAQSPGPNRLLEAATGAIGANLDSDVVSASRRRITIGWRTRATARSFTLFEARSINFKIVVYATVCMSMLDLH